MAYTTIDDPSAYFQTDLYAGNASTNVITNDGNSDLQPDWVWIKNRTTSGKDHVLYDSSRGVNKQFYANNTNAEDSVSNGLTSFNTDGFTLGDNGGPNASGNHVAWQWKANGGSRTTFTESGANPGGGYQANTTAGFSIVDYTGTGSAGTVSHGLGAEPKVLIVKNRDATTDWAVYHRNASSAGNDSYLELNTADAVATAGTVWNDTSPSSSVFTVGTNTKTNTDGEKYIAYCLTPIQGYSKFGSYTGNGNADGPFVYTGFKPAWLMIKRINSSNNWHMYDNKRDTFNVADAPLLANTTDAELTNTTVDFLSNGFKLRTAINFANGSEAYIYMAFAEHPFVSSKGVPVTAR